MISQLVTLPQRLPHGTVVGFVASIVTLPNISKSRGWLRAGGSWWPNAGRSRRYKYNFYLHNFISELNLNLHWISSVIVMEFKLNDQSHQRCIYTNCDWTKQAVVWICFIAQTFTERLLSASLLAVVWINYSWLDCIFCLGNNKMIWFKVPQNIVSEGYASNHGLATMGHKKTCTLKLSQGVSSNRGCIARWPLTKKLTKLIFGLSEQTVASLDRRKLHRNIMDML